MGRGERPMGFRQMGRGESTDSASLGQPICTEVNPCEFEAETESTRRRWKGNEVNDLRRER